MKEYQDCYIAFLDILGFKDMIKKYGCNELYEILAQDCTRRLASFSYDEISFEDVKGVLMMKQMSDSICFYIDSSIRNALFVMVETLRYYQADLLRRDVPILLRGAITRGEIFAENDIIFGQGFIDAYLKEENGVELPQIVLDKQLALDAKSLTEEKCWNLMICQYMNQSTDGRLSINYIECFEGHDINHVYSNKLYKNIQDILSSDAEDSVKKKYEYIKQQLLRWYNPNT